MAASFDIIYCLLKEIHILFISGNNNLFYLRFHGQAVHGLVFFYFRDNILQLFPKKNDLIINFIIRFPAQPV